MADVLGCSIGTVKRQISRALARLRVDAALRDPELEAVKGGEMSRYTEDDLRAVFADYSRNGPVRPPLVEEIVRRGRTARARRRMTVGAVLTGATAAVVMGGALLPGLLSEGAAGPADMSSARISPSAKPPETVQALNGETLTLIHFETHRTTGAPVTVTFRPTSPDTAYVIDCADSMAWLLMEWPGRGTTLGRCLSDGHIDSYTTKYSTASGWLIKPQSMKIWVFPSDSPIADPSARIRDGLATPEKLLADPYAGCRTADRAQGACDGKFLDDAVMQEPERVAAVIGRQEGKPWTVKIYDRPAVPSASPSPAR